VHWGLDAVYTGLAAALPFYAIGRMLTDAKTRARWGAYLRDVPQRFGARKRRMSDRPCVWIHGVSVGEVKAAARLVDEIERTLPGVEVVITVTTDTGYRVARNRYPDHRVEFYPPDLSWIVNDALDALRPDLMILVESEFWPNFLFAAERRDLPVVLVNGKMSERSAQRFTAFSTLSRELLGSLTEVCVQMPLYAERFLRVGVDPARVHVTGNMKFDNIPIKPDERRSDYFGAILGADNGMPLVVAGSTHPGEERTLAIIHRRLRAAGLPFRLVVAPRHPARADTVEADIRRQGGRVRRRSRMGADARPTPEEIVLLDTVGELELVYAHADVVFVGGTLVPHGGQNMMEPASLGRPVVIGPHMRNFRGEVEMLLHADALVHAPDEEAVEAAIRSWLQEPTQAIEVGRRAREAIQRSKGATERTLEVLRPLLASVAADGRRRVSGRAHRVAR
jgi:3-deoxy-D-manno-octulosonic-acid transferase